MRLLIFAASATLLLCGCTTTGGLDPLAAVGLTHSAYCALTPEARAEVGKMLGVRVPLLACPGDRDRRSRRG